jgi:hypothetical protein
VLALYSSMTAKEEEEEWRKLCALVAHESDPQRLSELIEQLFRELDSRRGQAFAAATGDKQSGGRSGC